MLVLATLLTMVLPSPDTNMGAILFLPSFRIEDVWTTRIAVTPATPVGATPATPIPTAGATVGATAVGTAGSVVAGAVGKDIVAIVGAVVVVVDSGAVVPLMLAVEVRVGFILFFCLKAATRISSHCSLC